MSDPLHPYFGWNVRWFRKMRGLGVNELAEKACVSASLVSAYERRTTNPKYDKAVKLAEVLEIPVEYLWDHRPPPAYLTEP